MSLGSHSGFPLFCTFPQVALRCSGWILFLKKNKMFLMRQTKNKCLLQTFEKQAQVCESFSFLIEGQVTLMLNTRLNRWKLNIRMSGLDMCYPAPKWKTNKQTLNQKGTPSMCLSQDDFKKQATMIRFWSLDSPPQGRTEFPRVCLTSPAGHTGWNHRWYQPPQTCDLPWHHSILPANGEKKVGHNVPVQFFHTLKNISQPGFILIIFIFSF